jgi:hypothetical protein
MASSTYYQQSTLPTELWLNILENTTIYEVEHLWTSVRPTSRQFRDYIERIFISTYLPRFTISLALPRRDSSSSILKWSGIIHNAQLVMSFEGVNQDEDLANFVSPLELKTGEGVTSVEELRASNVLPTARLLEAPTWLYANGNYLTGRPLRLPMDIAWDEDRKRWVRQVKWKRLVSRFYRAKMDARRLLPSRPHGQKWSRVRR